MYHKAKKSLGQNFLTSEPAIKTILDEGDIHADDIVLEIGPGKGVLTAGLIKLSGKTIAIEKDDDLYEFLKEKFSEEITQGRFDLIHGDVLDFNPQDLKFYKKPYKLIANIPYYITGLLFKKFLEEATFQPSIIVFLIQKEVAERIIARDKKESLLSVSIKAYGTPRLVKKVSAGSFFPAPNVDSAIMTIKDISKQRFLKAKVKEKVFFKILKAGFAHKRKVLIKNLEEVTSREKLEEIFQKLSISPKIRAEDLTIEEWFDIASEF